MTTYKYLDSPAGVNGVNQRGDGLKNIRKTKDRWWHTLEINKDALKLNHKKVISSLFEVYTQYAD